MIDKAPLPVREVGLQEEQGTMVDTSSAPTYATRDDQWSLLPFSGAMPRASAMAFAILLPNCWVLTVAVMVIITIPLLVTWVII
jgi:hypothetical protein